MTTGDRPQIPFNHEILAHAQVPSVVRDDGPRRSRNRTAGGERVATRAPAPVVWKLDNLASIGGHKPEVLGAPQVMDEAPGGRALRLGGRTMASCFRSIRWRVGQPSRLKCC